MKVTVSAPGKIHFMGEHAVVYGKPALLAAVNLRTFVTVEKRVRDGETSAQATIISSEPTDYVSHILDVVVRAYALPELPPVTVTVSSALRSGYHLGSSAAVAVATVGALSYFAKKLWNPEKINALAYEAEKKMHGNPSGGDNTAVTFGGFVWFRKELEFLKSMWQLTLKLPKELNHFALVDTGRPQESTGEMVEFVKLKMKNEKLKMERLMNKNEEQTRRIATAIKKGNEQELIDAIRVGERTLEGMGVVSRKVVPLIRSVERAGGAAKILGGGGRKTGVGFVLCYHRDQTKVKTLCAQLGFSLQNIRLGEEGVRLEKR